MSRNFYYMLLGMLSGVPGSDAITPETAQAIYSIRLLAKKHLRQAENSCNGYGVVKGQMYYSGSIDDYAKRTYGYGVKSAYTVQGSEETIFDMEYSRIADKIRKLLPNGFKVEFQGDPRGYTVKLSFNGRDITELIQK